jgi:hypothetical protein
MGFNSGLKALKKTVKLEKKSNRAEVKCEHLNFQFRCVEAYWKLILGDATT